MIPNNQYYFNNGKVNQSTYYLRQILADNVVATPPRHDGSSLVSYGGNLLLLFGWNANNSQSNEVYSSSDLGRTYSSLANAPFSSAEQQVEVRADGKLWVWFTTAAEVYNYDGSWHLIDTAAPSPLGGVTAFFNNQMYILGGQSAIGGSPVNATAVYRYNDGTGNWDTIGNIPSDVWTCTGTAWTDGAYIYVTGGGKVNAFSGTYEFLNDKIIRSGDGGITWSVYATLPSSMRAMWPEAIKYDNRVWYLNGYSGGANQTGLWNSTTRGQDWDLFTNSIPGRHATSICIHNDSLYIGWGNFWNDLYRIEKISYPTQGFIVPQVKTWWEKNWPLDRPSNALLTSINTFFNTLNTQTSLNPAKTQLQVLDYFAFVAGVENENQFLIPLISTNTSYLNGTTKLNGNPTWTTAGATTTLGNGAPIYSLNWRPDTQGINYVQNSASLVQYTLADVTDNFYEFGNVTSYIIRHHSDLGGRFYGQLNSGDFAINGVISGKGYTGVSRTNSTTLDVVIDATHNSATRNSTGVGSAKFSICGIDNAGTYGSIHVFGAIGMGSNELDHDKMRVAIQAFFTERGVSY